MKSKEQGIQTLTKFVIDNGLNFNDSGSGLNGACVALCGFAIYLEEEIQKENSDPAFEFSYEDLNIAVDKSFIRRPAKTTGYRKAYVEELERVLNYAYNNNYGNYWRTSEAKKMYKF